MYNDVSLELRNKIRKELDIIEGKVTTDGNYLATLTFSKKELNLSKECKDWLNTITTLYESSYDAYRLTKIGRFEGVRPKEVADHFVLFSVKKYNKESWMDWFKPDNDDNDGYLQGTVGNILNKRTYPQYYK